MTEELFSRREVARLLGLSEGEVRYWERAELVKPAKRQGREVFFDFKGLVAFRTLRELRQKGLSPRRIRRCLLRLKKIAPGAEQPLAEVTVTVEGKEVVFHREGLKIDPRGQLLLAFPDPHAETLSLVPREEDLFFEALEAEEEGRWDEAEGLLRRLLEEVPQHLDALVNLGNVRLKLGHPQEAEGLYRKVLSLDPDHVEANYNLACLLEERGQVEDAILFYRKALHEAPDFADAHFNLARVLEKKGLREEATLHWRRYLELDPFSPWADWVRRHLGAPDGKEQGP